MKHHPSKEETEEHNEGGERDGDVERQGGGGDASDVTPES